MKLLFASDIHGDIECAKALFSIYENEKADKIIFLGDMLYHGPRNDLPPHYAPKEVIALANRYKNALCCVRGNCESEVDQMVLEFPVMADYMMIWERGRRFFITHGHLYHMQNPPPLGTGDLLIHGHTHVLAVTPFGNENYYLNPGSVTLPKEGNPRTYMLYEDGVFSIRTLDGKELLRHEI